MGIAIAEVTALICAIAEENFETKFYENTDISDNPELLAVLVIRIDELFPNNYICMENILECRTIKEVVNLIIDDYYDTEG